MRSFFKKFFIVGAVLAVTACDNFEYHPYAADIGGETDINLKNISLISARNTRLPIRFAFITDTQTSYDELKEALKAMKRRGDIDFIVNGGDITDLGLPKEFVWFRNIMSSSGFPYVTVIGNHDTLGNGKQTYNYLFGATNYSFDVAGVHFLMLNTNALDYDYSEPIPDFDFIYEDADKVARYNGVNVDEPITHTVAVMHSRPLDGEFNNNVVRPFIDALSLFPGMGADDDVIENSADQTLEGTRRRGFCLNGHNHGLSVTNVHDRGILWHQCANMGKRVFFVVTINSDGYEIETVDF